MLGRTEIVTYGQTEFNVFQVLLFIVLESAIISWFILTFIFRIEDPLDCLHVTISAYVYLSVCLLVRMLFLIDLLILRSFIT